MSTSSSSGTHFRKGKHYGMLSYISSRTTPLLPLQKYLKYVVKISNEDKVQRTVKSTC
jgi:hypothetical protein